MVTRYIYCYTNIINNKSYIGLTKNINKRKMEHLNTSLNGNGQVFHRAVRKYGISNFLFQILEECYTLEEANQAESFYIALFETLSPNGYNLTTG